MLDYTTIGLTVIILIFFIITFFILIEIMRRTSKDIKYTFIHLLLALIFLILTRLVHLLETSEIISFNDYTQEILVLLFSFFFLMYSINFFKNLRKKTDGID